MLPQGLQRLRGRRQHVGGAPARPDDDLPDAEHEQDREGLGPDPGPDLAAGPGAGAGRRRLVDDGGQDAASADMSVPLLLEPCGESGGPGGDLGGVHDPGVRQRDVLLVDDRGPGGCP